MRGILVIPFIREMELWELWECFFCMVGGTLSFGMTSGCIRDGGQGKINEKSTENQRKINENYIKNKKC